MTSPTTAFTLGASPACLQALHDTAPPDDSQTFNRAPRSRFGAAAPPVAVVTVVVSRVIDS